MLARLTGEQIHLIARPRCTGIEATCAYEAREHHGPDPNYQSKDSFADVLWLLY